MKTKKLLPILISVFFVLTLALCASVDLSAYAADGVTTDSVKDGTIKYIDSEADFLEMMRRGATSSDTYIMRTDVYLDRYYAENDADLKLAEFSGTLLGRGHAIVGLTVTPSYVTYNEPDGQGGTVDKYAYISAFIGKNTGTVKDLKLVDLYLSDGQPGFTDIVYAPIGINEGTVENVKALFTADGAVENGVTYSDMGGGTSSGVAVCADFDGSGSTAENYDVNDVFTLAMAFNAGGNITLTGDVNLYNSELFKSKTNELKGLSDTFGFYNASVYGLNGIPDKAASAQLPTAATKLNGVGDEAEPFEISTLSELLYLKGNSASGFYYYMLTDDISLTDDVSLTGYVIDGSLLGDFNGVLDGNGYAVTGLTAPLASAVGTGSVIKNLTVDVNFGSSTVAVLGGVSGRISNVMAMGSASVFVEFKDGTADGVSVLRESNDDLYTYAVSGTWSSLNRVRSYAEYFYQGSETTLTVRNCYQDNGEWGAQALNVAGSRSDGSPADADKVESLITSTNAGYSNYNSDAGWKFGADLGFAIEKGASAVTLVFPEDRSEYKFVPVFSKSGTTEVIYGDSAYIQFADFFAEATNGAKLATQNELTVFELNGVLSEFLTVPLGDANVGFKWIGANGQQISGSVAATDENAGATLKYYLSGSHLIDVTLYRTDSRWVLSGTIIEYAYTAAKLAGHFADVLPRLDDMGLTENASNLFGYDGVRFAVLQGNNVIIDSEDTQKSGKVIYAPGDYTLVVDIAGTDNYTPSRIVKAFRIAKGNIDYAVDQSSLYEIRNEETVKGGFAEDTAPEYSENAGNVTLQLSLPDLWLNLIGEELKITYRVSGYNAVNGAPAAKTAINDAGTYTLTVTVSAPNYNDFTVYNIVYRVKPVKRTISVNEKIIIAYGDDIPTLTGTAADSTKTYDLTVIGTDYAKFSVPRRYYIDYKVSADHIANNYDFIYASPSEAVDGAGRLYFTVTKKTVTFDQLKAAGVFADAEVVYDGNAHRLSFNSDAFPYVTGDPNEGRYAFSPIYLHNGASQAEPFAFTEVGEYIVELDALTISGTPDYYEITVGSATAYNAYLTILPRGVTVAADNVAVDYNSVPQYTYTLQATDPDYPIDGLLDEITAALEPGTHFVVTSEYKKGDYPSLTAAEPLTIAVTISAQPKNFVLTAKNGELTINKLVFSDTENINIRSEYVFNNKAVTIEYIGAYSPDSEEAFKKDGEFFAAGYPKFYEVNGSDGVLLDGAPTNANLDGGHYIIELKAANTEVFTDETVELEFTVSRHTPTFEVQLYTKENGLQSLIAAYSFDGREYQLTVNAADIYDPFNNIFSATVTYYSDGVPMTATERYVALTAPAVLTKIEYSLTPKPGYDRNYNGGKATYENFTLHRAELAPTEHSFRIIYNGSDFFDDLYAAAGIDFPYVSGYEYPLEYSAYRSMVNGVTAVPTTEVLYPGTYYLTFTENEYYYFDGWATVEVVPYVMGLDFSTGLSNYYGRVSWTGNGLRVNDYAYSDGNFQGRTGLILGITDEYLDKFEVTADYVGVGFAEPFVYNITAAEAVVATDPIVNRSVEIIRFNILNGEDAYTVLPAEVRMGALPDQFEYGADIAGAINAAIGFTGTANLGSVRVTYDGDVTDYKLLNAGDHTFEITLIQPTAKVDRYKWVGESRFDFTVTPKPLVYSVASAEVSATGNVPESFEYSLSYNGSAVAVPAGVTAEFRIRGEVSSGAVLNAGEYDVDIIFSGLNALNYDFVKSDSSGKLTVVLDTLSQDIRLSVTEYTYTGYAIELQFENTPDGFTAENVPTNAGAYNVELLLSAPGYRSETRAFEFTVLPAVPVVTVSNIEMIFESGYTLTAADIRGEAAVGATKVDGAFSFVGGSALTYGLRQYLLTFTPTDSANIQSVTGIPMYVNAYISDEAAAEYFTVIVSKDVGGNAVMEPLPQSGAAVGNSVILSVSSKVAADTTVTYNGNALNLTETGFGTKILTINIGAGLKGDLVFRVQGQAVRTWNLDLTPYIDDGQSGSDDPETGEPVDPDDGETDGGTDGGNNMGGNHGGAQQGGQNAGTSSGGVNVTLSEDGKKTLIIVCSSVGGAVVLAAVIVLIVVSVKKSRKKNTGK